MLRMTAESIINVPALFDLCRKWKVKELSIFGSALRGDFRATASSGRPESDIDLLVTFVPEAQWSLFDHARMESEFEAALDRKVDLVSRSGLERSSNWIRRNAILSSARVVYAA